VKLNAILLKGIAAGFVATAILSALMLTKKWLPQFDTVTLLDGIANGLALDAGLPSPFAGWLWHFIVGALVWGWIYAVMEPIIPGRRPWRKGMYFGLMVTLLVWFTVMPLARAGAFETDLSWMQAFVSLIQHLIYGVALALAFDRLPIGKQ